MAYRQLTGRPAPRVEDTGVRSIRSLVRKLGGSKAAAQELGVSTRTVQRWTTSGKRSTPSAASKQRITDTASAQRQRDLTKAASGRRAKTLSSQPRKLYVSGRGGPADYNDELRGKDRSIWMDVSPEDIANLYAAAASPDPEAFKDAVVDICAVNYFGSAVTDDTHAQTWGWAWIDSLELR